LLYKKYPTFKEEFTSILNWLLMPTEFEAAWAALVQKYNLQNDPMMMQLWSDRKMWISAYYKNIFFARMTSTQRSESMNHVLKRGFVKGTQNLHKFARRVNACIQTRMQKENEQTMTRMILRQKKHPHHIVTSFNMCTLYLKNETHNSASTNILFFDMCRPIL
jgi:hypothetical protein